MNENKQTTNTVAFFVLMMLILLPACSKKFYYDSFEQAREHNCYREDIPDNKREDCLNMAKTPYEAYKDDIEINKGKE